jgi:hypothetical protein
MKNRKLNKNPVSPKVKWPVYMGILAQVLLVASQQDWSEANTVTAILTVAYAAVGYFVTDPNRRVET